MLDHALRSLWRDRAFSLPAILTVGVGVGATTAVTSLAYAVLLKPFPYPESHRLVRVFTVLGEERDVERDCSLLDLRDYNLRATLIRNFGGYTEYDSQLQGVDGAEAVPIAQLNQEALRALGVAPLLGRLFEPEEDREGGPVHRAILSHSLWTSRYGGDPAILGKLVVTPQTSFEVVGVMPAGFAFPDRARIWLPMESWYALSLDNYQRKQRDQRWYRTVARLEPGVTLAQAQAEMDAIAAALASEHPDTNRGVRVKLVPFRDAEVGAARPYVLVLVFGVVLLLAICLANVGNLVLVRVLERRRQLAVRAALGASRLEIAKGPLLEGLALCLAGGLLGAALAWAGVRTFARLLPETLPGWVSLEVDLPIFAFCLVLTLATGLGLGAAPAWLGAAVDLRAVLEQGSRGSSSRARGRAVLILVEVALSFVLLVGAGLLVLTFVRMQRADHGFESDNLLVVRVIQGRFSVDPRAERAAFYAAHHEPVLERLARLPGVSRVAVSNRIPYAGGPLRSGRLRVLGMADEELRFVLPIAGADVSGAFFETLGIPLLRGRTFLETDTSDAAPVVVINERAAAALFGDRDPLGQMLQWGDTVEPANPYCRVVGVVGDVKHGAVERDTIELYYPFTQWSVASGYYVLRTTVDQSALAGPVREAIREVDPLTAVVWVKAMNDRIDETLWQRRLWGALFAAFAAVAVLLASVGLYGLLSYVLAQRRREIGVRLALGATPRRVGSMVATDGLKLIASGLVLGVLGAAGLVRLIASLLEGVAHAGWNLYLAAALVVLAAGSLACGWPALRAARIEPVRALRDS